MISGPKYANIWIQFFLTLFVIFCTSYLLKFRVLLFKNHTIGNSLRILNFFKNKKFGECLWANGITYKAKHNAPSIRLSTKWHEKTYRAPSAFERVVDAAIEAKHKCSSIQQRAWFTLYFLDSSPYRVFFLKISRTRAFRNFPKWNIRRILFSTMKKVVSVY